MTKAKFSQEKILQDIDILLDNLKNQPIIAEKMKAFTYDEAKIQEGKTLWNIAKQQYELTKQESAESTQAYADYTSKWKELQQIYSFDRQKVRTLFKGKDEVLKALAVDKPEARVYSVWITEVERFYERLQQHSEYLKALEAMQLNLDHVKAQQPKVQEVIRLYSNYIREKGESQDATQKKDIAFKNLQEWVRTCYGVAKIALRDHKQLLESLAKLVKG